LGDTTEAIMWGGEIIIAFDTKTCYGKNPTFPVVRPGPQMRRI